jgi:hypothetical protein
LKYATIHGDDRQTRIREVGPNSVAYRRRALVLDRLGLANDLEVRDFLTTAHGQMVILRFCNKQRVDETRIIERLVHAADALDVVNRGSIDDHVSAARPDSLRHMNKLVVVGQTRVQQAEAHPE